MVGVIFLVGILVGLGIARLPGMNPAAGEANIVVDLGAEKAAPVERLNVSVDDDPWVGKADAKVTLVEFTDFQCSYCARHIKETFPQIEEKYINTGKLRYVSRDLPLKNHRHAPKAAEAANCALDQEEYWEMHDQIFLNQADWSGSDKDAVSIFKGYAKEMGLDTDEFAVCLDSGKYEREVQSDKDAATALDVKGTPHFFVNGRRIKGAQPFEKFAEVIEEELALVN